MRIGNEGVVKRSPTPTPALNCSRSGPKENSTSSKSIIVPKDSTENYEDYVVQNGDTASSISENKYSDKTLSSVITSFNGISSSLLPGTILKIPTKAFVDAYVSGNTKNNKN